MEVKEIISTEISNITYSSLDLLINKWLKENKQIITHKIHYQLAATNGKFRSSVLIEYTKNENGEGIK